MVETSQSIKAYLSQSRGCLEGMKPHREDERPAQRMGGGDGENRYRREIRTKGAERQRKRRRA